jgi:hypothetical protein
MSPKANPVSQHFDATLASSSQPCRPVLPTLVDVRQLYQAPRLSSSALQHIRSKVPFFSLSVARKRLEYNAQYPKSPTLRVWLPSLWCQLPQTLETSFSSQRSWASPFKALLLSHDRFTLSDQSLRSCALPQNPLGPRTSAPAAYSHRKSRAPLTATQRISPGRSLLLSWAFWPLRLPPFPDP